MSENENKIINSSSSSSFLKSTNEQQCLKNTSYKLYGVLVHLGYTSHSGHYYSYVRGPNNVWYKADDQQVNIVQSQDALEQNAYILFYNRISNNNNNNNNSSNMTISTTTINMPKKDNFESSFLTKTNTTTNQLIHFNIPKLVNNNLNLPVDPIEKTINILPENKFKSTFVAVETATTTTTTTTNPTASIDDSTDKKLITESLEKNTKSDTILTTTDNQSKTLNYEQVLKIKKLNKKNLKLLNKKKELDELKKLNTEEKDSKKIRKQIKKLTKQIKKDKIKIKKFKKRNKKFLKSDSNATDDSETTSSDETSSKKGVNSLSLLKQYRSSSSSSSSLESSPFSSPKSHSRSSFSSARSSSLSSLSTATSSQSSSSSSSLLKSDTVSNKKRKINDIDNEESEVKNNENFVSQVENCLKEDKINNENDVATKSNENFKKPRFSYPVNHYHSKPRSTNDYDENSKVGFFFLIYKFMKIILNFIILKRSSSIVQNLMRIQI
jgi:hypothetical protein